MVSIAVTGGIACGKSLFGAMLVESGIAVCEADELAHAALEPGAEAFADVAREFGGGVLAADGRIDRRALGAVVFSDASRLQRLNALVHPHVVRRMAGWLRERSESGAQAAAVIIPLLYEVGLSGTWDAEVCVCSPARAQVERLMGRGFAAPEAWQRIQAQWPLSAKCERADYVLVNNGTEARFRRQAKRVIDRILER